MKVFFLVLLFLLSNAQDSTTGNGPISSTTGIQPIDVNKEIKVLKREIKEIKLYLYELKNIVALQSDKIDSQEKTIRTINNIVNVQQEEISKIENSILIMLNQTSNYVTKSDLLNWLLSLGPCNDRILGDLCRLGPSYGYWLAHH